MRDVAPGEQVLVYVRPGEAPSDSILIILNYGPSRADVTIGADTIALMQSREFVDLLTGNEIIPDGSTVSVAGHAVRILKSKKHAAMR